MISRSMS